MSDQYEHLPALIEQNPELASMGEMVGISDEVLSMTLLGAQPALERAQLVEMDGERLWFASPEDPEPNESRLSVGSREPIHLDYRVPRKGFVHDRAEVVDFNTIWANDEVSLRAKLDQRRAYEHAKEELVAQHPLGKGALVVANEFGGINCDDPEGTARHLVLRAIIAKQAGLKRSELVTHRDKQTSEYVEAGLLHPLLGKILDEDFMKLMEGVDKLVDAVTLLPEAARKQAGPALLEGAIQQSRAFVEEHRDEIAVAAVVSQDPSRAIKIAEEAKRVGEQSDSTWHRVLGKLAIAEEKE